VQRTWPSRLQLLGVSICFMCEDVLATYREVTSRGIQASRPIASNGMWNTDLSDPDGYRIESDSYRDVQEGPALPV
jgi:lactoylglutathione lyase